jgi:hypothetical protein
MESRMRPDAGKQRACSVWPEEDEAGRNWRRKATVCAGNRRPWRRHEAPGLDSLHEDDQGEEAVLVVLSER